MTRAVLLMPMTQVRPALPASTRQECQTPSQKIFRAGKVRLLRMKRQFWGARN